MAANLNSIDKLHQTGAPFCHTLFMGGENKFIKCARYGEKVLSRRVTYEWIDSSKMALLVQWMQSAADFQLQP